MAGVVGRAFNPAGPGPDSAYRVAVDFDLHGGGVSRHAEVPACRSVAAARAISGEASDSLLAEARPPDRDAAERPRRGRPDRKSVRSFTTPLDHLPGGANVRGRMQPPGRELQEEPDIAAGAETAGRPTRLARLHPDCPTRPVDWRWERVGLMLKLGRRWSSRRDDGPTREAKRYRAAWQRCRDDSGRLRLAGRAPGVAGACGIRDGAPRVRWAVEARLLAGEPIDALAGKVGRTPEAVAWFETLFFHVTDRLRSRGYLVHEAIGGRFHRGPAARDLDVLWKVFGVFGGVTALDAHQRHLGRGLGVGKAVRDALGCRAPSRADRFGARRHDLARRTADGGGSRVGRPSSAWRSRNGVTQENTGSSPPC